MALDYLTIPGSYLNEVQLSSSNVLIFLVWKLATSINVEQVFSQGQIVLSHLCSRLSVQTMRALMCLGAWSHQGFVKDRDIKAVVILPEIPTKMKEDDLAVGWDTIFTWHHCTCIILCLDFRTQVSSKFRNPHKPAKPPESLQTHRNPYPDPSKPVPIQAGMGKHR